MKCLIYIKFCLLILLCSCMDLSEEVFSQLTADRYPENEAQINFIIQEPFGNLTGFGDHEGWFAATEITSDLIVVPTRREHWGDGGEWRMLHTHTWTANTNRGIGRVWGFFTGISRCNQTIEFLEGLEKSDFVITAIARVKGLRAFYYYLLIDHYGDVPYVTTYANAPATPEKETRANVFNNLIKELKEEVIPNLDNHTNKALFDKYTAYGLMAKLYLNAEIFKGEPEWELASKYCDSVIIGPYALEVNRLGPFITENQFSSENIFTVPFDEMNYHGFLRHRATLHYNQESSFNARTNFWNGICATEKLVDLFESNDTRLKGLLVGPQIKPNGDTIYDNTINRPLVFTKEIPALNMGTSNSTQEQARMAGARMLKFEVKQGVMDNLSNDFPIFRLADFILMKAECELRLGNTSVAIDLVNQIRGAAGASLWTEGNLTLESLLDERGRELWSEGHRRQDLIRFGKFTGSWWEKDGGDVSKNVFPIPQWATNTNPNLLK
jgi:starch-binding outer membrane protein, SusD/RagB family